MVSSTVVLLVKLLALGVGSTMAAFWCAATLGLSVRLFLWMLGG